MHACEHIHTNTSEFHLGQRKCWIFSAFTDDTKQAKGPCSKLKLKKITSVKTRKLRVSYKYNYNNAKLEIR